jgi:hypothetical protein
VSYVGLSHRGSHQKQRIEIMKITKDTKLSDLIAQYPWLKEEMVKVNEKFKMLNSPVGKLMMGKATIAEMSKKSGMEADIIISRINELITNHTNQ